MGKPQRERTLKDNEARAKTRLIRVSPQKLNLVAGMIRGMKAEDALKLKALCEDLLSRLAAD